MLTPNQKRRYDLYIELKSLAKVANLEGVSRECIRQTLEAMPQESVEYQNFKAIANQSTDGRP